MDSNLGNYASLFNVPVATLSGSNVVGIQSQGDLFAWNLALLVTPVAAIPEPSAYALMLTGIILLALVTRRVRRRCNSGRCNSLPGTASI